MHSLSSICHFHHLHFGKIEHFRVPDAELERIQLYAKKAMWAWTHG